MAKTREQSQEAREAKLDELHERLTGAVRLFVRERQGLALSFPKPK
jgi:hypothetical protein